jgi:hypothetical protein
MVLVTLPDSGPQLTSGYNLHTGVVLVTLIFIYPKESHTPKYKPTQTQRHHATHLLAELQNTS